MTKILLSCLLLLVACSYAFVSQAQTTYSSRGFVYTKSPATERLAFVLVTNKRTKVVTYTNDLGEFNIKTTLGDTLEFAKVDYNHAQQVMMSAADLVIYMPRITHLQQVEIKGVTKQQELNEVINAYRSKGLYFDGRPPWWVFSPISGSPLTGFYELFGHDAHNERRFIKLSKIELAASQDSRKYNKEIIKKITNLPDEDVQKFIDTYQPSHADLLKWNDYEVIAYIKKSYESFKKYGADALPKLY